GNAGTAGRKWRGRTPRTNAIASDRPRDATETRAATASREPTQTSTAAVRMSTSMAGADATRRRGLLGAQRQRGADLAGQEPRYSSHHVAEQQGRRREERDRDRWRYRLDDRAQPLGEDGPCPPARGHADRDAHQERHRDECAGLPGDRRRHAAPAEAEGPQHRAVAAPLAGRGDEPV